MKKTKRVISLVLSVVMLATLAAACSNDTGGGAGDGGSAGQISLGGGKDIYNDPIKISVISISTAGIVNQLYQMALKEQAFRYPNVFLDFKDAEFDPSRQITLIEEAITQGYDAILLECMDPFAINNAIEEAERAGIPVISSNAAEPMTLHSLHIAGADYSTGWESGRLMAEMTGGEGTAVILDCPAMQKPGARMGTGFQEYIEQNTNIKLLEPPIGIENWSADNAQTSMRDVLTKYGPGEITMVYCSSDDIANGAMNAIEQAGRSGEILVWGFMGYPMGLEGVKSGKMAGTMFSDTYVQYAALFYMTMLHIATGLTAYTAGYETTPMVEQPMFPVTPQNVENIMAVSRWYS
ncbi:MAG: sugar ABC transporter substrate-binding protein [Oscillospiraceae bacterium]|nr:sugar ABC transporter substrate-binding protein [Oscillospiraceae bacterium]